MKSALRRYPRSWPGRLACLVLAAALAWPLLAAAPSTALAQGFGDLIVSPTRLVFEGRKTSDHVLLSNRGSETATFRISLSLMAMDEDGSLNEIQTPPPGLESAEGLLRFAPRQVVIPPGGTQVVRVALRKPADLATGEYRSHLFMRAVPPESRGVDIGAGPQADGELRIELIPIFGVSIPLIVRQGDMAAEARLDNLALVAGEQGPVVQATLHRSGSGSIFGDVVVRYLREGQAPIVVGQVSRLAVYPEIDRRRLAVALALPDGVTLGAGRLEVAYRAPGDDGPPLTSATLDLN